MTIAVDLGRKATKQTKHSKIVVCLNKVTFIFVLFDLILYVPSTIFKLYRDGSSWVEPVLQHSV